MPKLQQSVQYVLDEALQGKEFKGPILVYNCPLETVKKFIFTHLFLLNLLSFIGSETSNYELEFSTASNEIRYLLVNVSFRPYIVFYHYFKLVCALTLTSIIDHFISYIGYYQARRRF